jgi:hypothetical protein
MSKEAVEAIIGKAVVDSEFREALFANPDEALARYELTEVEIAALKATDAETMESFAGTLDERISKMLVAADVGGAGGRLAEYGKRPGLGLEKLYQRGPEEI